MIKGAGGTSGGIGRFFIGLMMMVAGGYLFLNAIQVTHQFHLGYALFAVGNVRLTTGMTLIPLIFGVGLIFYNAKNALGWILTGASLVMIFAGIIASIQFRLRSITGFDLIMILALVSGGAGLFLSSLRSLNDS